jgi:hypothetical protein
LIVVEVMVCVGYHGLSIFNYISFSSFIIHPSHLVFRLIGKRHRNSEIVSSGPSGLSVCIEPQAQGSWLDANRVKAVFDRPDRFIRYLIKLLSMASSASIYHVKRRKTDHDDSRPGIIDEAGLYRGYIDTTRIKAVRKPRR